MAEPARASSAAEEISTRMSRSFVSPKTLLSRMSAVDSPRKMATVYQDPNYLPFYFHLGRVLKPKSVFCVGLELGLQMGCMSQGCDAPLEAVCVQPPPDHFYSPRMALSNIKSASNGRSSVSVYIGDVADYRDSLQAPQGFDMAMVIVPTPPDSLMNALDICWSFLKPGGFLVVDQLDQKKADLVFSDFCRARSLDFGRLNTRYGAGIAGR